MRIQSAVLGAELAVLTQVQWDRLYKAKDFEGVGGPEDKVAAEKEANPGSDEVRDNIR